MLHFSISFAKALLPGLYQTQLLWQRNVSTIPNGSSLLASQPPTSMVLQLFVIINHSHIFSFLSRSFQHYVAMCMLPSHVIGQSTAASRLYQTELLRRTNVSTIPQGSSFHVCQSPTSCPSLRRDPRDVLCTMCRTGHFQQTGHG